MSCCVKKHLNFLCLLSKTHPTQQDALLETAEPDQIRAICECIYNILKGNIYVPEAIKEQLRPNRNILRDIADEKISYNNKKKLLVQKGGTLLSALLPIAVSGISSLLKNVL